MPVRDFIPAKDADLLAWAANFSALITATPIPFGLVAADATALATATTAFTTSLAAATNPATRTSVTVATKDANRASLVVMIRALAARIQGTQSVNASQKTNLGLTVRSTSRTPIPAPTVRPLTSIVSTSGGNLDLRISSESSPDSRAMPNGTIGANVYVAAGTTAPLTLDGYDFRGFTGKGIATIDVASYPVGTVLHVVTRYTNRRGDLGPASIPTSQLRAA